MIASVGIELVPALDDRVDHVLEYLEAFLVTSSETHAQMRLEHTALQQYHITSSSTPHCNNITSPRYQHRTAAIISPRHQLRLLRTRQRIRIGHAL
jgi:hypothetical protein